MTEKNAAAGGKNPNDKARKNKELIETALSESFGKDQPTDEFRQTLLKSGLDIAEFQADEPKPAQNSGNEFLKSGAADSAKNRNEILEAGLIQSSGEPSGKDEKNPARFGRWQHLTAVAGILAIIVLQSAFQVFFIQDENERVAENVIKNDLPVGETSERSPNDSPVSESLTPEINSKTPVGTKAAYKKRAAESPVPAKKSAPNFRREPKINAPRTASRKKEGRESNAERLRRVEKILTGI